MPAAATTRPAGAAIGAVAEPTPASNLPSALAAVARLVVGLLNLLAIDGPAKARSGCCNEPPGRAGGPPRALVPPRWGSWAYWQGRKAGAVLAIEGEVRHGN